MQEICLEKTISRNFWSEFVPFEQVKEGFGNTAAEIVYHNFDRLLVESKNLRKETPC